MKAIFRGGAMGAALLPAAAAMATPGAAQIYHSGQVCWSETPCPGLGEERPKAATAAPPKGVARARGKAAANKRPATVTLSLARSAPAVSAPRFYRYPTMYNAEAPPLLPPGAQFCALCAATLRARVPGHLVLARRQRFQDAAGARLRAVIDPSRVISW